MRAEEAEGVAAITRECPEAAQWGAADYAKLVADGNGTEAARSGDGMATWNGKGGCVLVAEIHGSAEGFAVVRSVADELEVLNVGVTPAQRKRGIGSALLEAAFAAARGAGARAAFCEVRESNAAAQAFYERHEFVRTGRRPRYYTDPAEDAIVMAKILEKRE